MDNGGTYCNITVEPFDHKNYVRMNLITNFRRKQQKK